jgi:hypothetical protein
LAAAVLDVAGALGLGDDEAVVVLLMGVGLAAETSFLADDLYPSLR